MSEMSTMVVSDLYACISFRMANYNDDKYYYGRNFCILNEKINWNQHNNFKRRGILILYRYKLRTRREGRLLEHLLEQLLADF